MTRRWFRVALSVVSCAVVARNGVEAKPTPAAKCAAAVQKAAAKRASAEVACYTKAVAAALPVNGVCLGKAVDAFRAAVTKADNAGGCAFPMAPRFLDAVVDAAVAAVAVVAADLSTTDCTSFGASCGTTCEGHGVCLPRCDGLGMGACVDATTVVPQPPGHSNETCSFFAGAPSLFMFNGDVFNGTPSCNTGPDACVRPCP